MRVSDRQREAASALLRRRFGDGYLSLDTLVERLDAVHSARDRTQLHGPPAALPPSDLAVAVDDLRARALVVEQAPRRSAGGELAVRLD